jgi:nitrate reductase NapE component
MHTYRNPNARRPKIGSAVVPLLLFALFPLLSVPFGYSLDRTGVTISAVFIAAALILYRAVERHHRDVECGEVRLDDGGTCELETFGHVTRIHVSEIRAVEYRRDSESGAERYVIRYRDAKAELGGNTTDFADFLGRLKALNPAVDVSSFPTLVAETLPEGTPSERRSLLETFLRSRLFPLVVLVLLIYLAGQTVIK